MNLKDMTEKSLLFFDVEWGTKEKVISNLVDALDQNGYLNSKEEYFKAVMEREDISPTGFEAGLAIPHGKSTAVKKAAFAVARLKNKMAGWESIDPNNQVELVFLLAIPGAEAGSTHLSLFSELSTRLMDQNYYQRLMNAKNAEQFLSAIDQVEEKAADSQSLLRQKDCSSVLGIPRQIHCWSTRNRSSGISFMEHELPKKNSVTAWRSVISLIFLVKVLTCRRFSVVLGLKTVFYKEASIPISLLATSTSSGSRLMERR